MHTRRKQGEYRRNQYNRVKQKTVCRKTRALDKGGGSTFLSHTVMCLFMKNKHPGFTMIDGGKSSTHMQEPTKMIHLFQGETEEKQAMTREEMNQGLMHVIVRAEQRVSRIEEKLAYFFHKTQIEEKGITAFETCNQMDLEEIVIPMQKEVLGCRLTLNIIETELKHYAKLHQIKDAPELLEDYENVRRHIQLVRILYLEDLEPELNDAFMARLGSLNGELCKENGEKAFRGVDVLLEKYFGIYQKKNASDGYGMLLLEELFRDLAFITGEDESCEAILDALKKEKTK